MTTQLNSLAKDFERLEETVGFNTYIFEDYGDVIDHFKKWPVDQAESYLTTGLAAEIGEVLGAYAKFYRGDYDEDELRSRISKELGDVMFFMTALCQHEGLRLEELMLENAAKLRGRLEAGTILGDGDER